METYQTRDYRPKEKNQLCLCKCSEWCELGFQVAKWNGKKFDYPDAPNDNFDDYVESWMPLDEDGNPYTYSDPKQYLR